MPLVAAVIFSAAVAQPDPTVVTEPLGVFPFLPLHMQCTPSPLETATRLAHFQWVMSQWQCPDEITASTWPASGAIIPDKLFREHITKIEHWNLYITVSITIQHKGVCDCNIQ